MARDYLAYARQLKALFPRGRAWTIEEGTFLYDLLNGLGAELARVDARVSDLLAEGAVATTSELLAEHETDWGIPDDCLNDSSMSIADRRTRLLSRVRAFSGLDAQGYVEIASALGYTVTINPQTPFWSGLGVSGNPTGDQSILFVWLVDIDTRALEATTYFLSGVARSGDLLQYVKTSADLICTFNKLRPAHTRVVFRYVGPAFDNAFDSAFDSMSSSYITTTGAFDISFGSAFPVFYGADFEPQAFSDGFAIGVRSRGYITDNAF